MELDFLNSINQQHLQKREQDDLLESRIKSFELAFQLQREAPELQDISSESKAAFEMYGINEKATRNFGIQCLMARRFAEAGVRFIQVSHAHTLPFNNE